jgi:hypothetical protein
MKHRARLALFGLACGALACADPTGTSMRGDAALAVSNPPPPPVTGRVTGTFDVSSADLQQSGSVAPGLSLSIAAHTISHTFSTEAVFDRNDAGTISTITVGTGPHAVTYLTGVHGQTSGTGLLTETDELGDIWSINFAQYAGHGGLGECAVPPDSPHEDCVALGGSVVARVKIPYTDRHGNTSYTTYSSSAGDLTFIWTKPTP